jgi:hypothetical protein
MIDAFSRLPWHDSKLLGFRVAYGDSDRSIVTLDVDFRARGDVGGRTEVRFDDVRGIYADVDLLAKGLCSDHIAGGYCERAEESTEAFVRQINERFDLYRGQTVDGFFLFGLELIHPAGKVLLLARSFSLF